LQLEDVLLRLKLFLVLSELGKFLLFEVCDATLKPCKALVLVSDPPSEPCLFYFDLLDLPLQLFNFKGRLSYLCSELCQGLFVCPCLLSFSILRFLQRILDLLLIRFHLLKLLLDLCRGPRLFIKFNLEVIDLLGLSPNVLFKIS
jgi:hypothetical protein